MVLEDQLKASEGRTQNTIESMQSIVYRCETKVDQCEPADKIISKVNEIYKLPVEVLRKDIDRLASDTNLRIQKIYKEELWEAGQIGPECQFYNLKQYIAWSVDQLQEQHVKFSSQSMAEFKHQSTKLQALDDQLEKDVQQKLVKLRDRDIQIQMDLESKFKINVFKFTKMDQYFDRLFDFCELDRAEEDSHTLVGRFTDQVLQPRLQQFSQDLSQVVEQNYAKLEQLEAELQIFK